MPEYEVCGDYTGIGQWRKLVDAANKEEAMKLAVILIEQGADFEDDEIHSTSDFVASSAMEC